MIPASVRIFVCTKPQDMRRSFDGLALTAQQVLSEDPRSGALFVFTNKRRSRLKVLWWDRNGYCLLTKRLHGALFQLPVPSGSSDSKAAINGRALGELLRGIASMRRGRARDRS
ncbi:IS66 family insertion sequence element accessory protein TnpB [Nannocystis pusilla]|uniref:IS66 family insertion sequence element accessory protein TnpB n=1 Tax=Nannocystis pusilla TaxID=889268 RepID=UPI003DA5415B